MPGQKINKMDMYQRIIDRVFKPMKRGQLLMHLNDGSVLTYGENPEELKAAIRVNHASFFKKCVLFGDVGFGESYVDGDWDTDDIAKVVEWMILNLENHPTMVDDKKKIKPVNFLAFANRIIHFLRQNTLYGSRKNIMEHYDLGNDFFKTFLDPTMAYSCAYFDRENMRLEDAQISKFEKLCQKLKLRSSDHLLEIGSGWGGFALYAAKRYGCRITTITVSQAQFDHVKELIQCEHLEDRISIELKDYRQLTGQFDKIVSVEMIEAVGHEFLPAYFKQCHRLLKKDGLLVVQGILSPDHRYDYFRKNVDWIQKHIFPGSLLPSISTILKAVNRTGQMNLHDLEDMTLHYVKTLWIWRQNFNLNRDKLHKLGLNDTFIRKWNYYFAYCEAAFYMRNISVAQMVFSRPNNLTLNDQVADVRLENMPNRNVSKAVHGFQTLNQRS